MPRAVIYARVSSKEQVEEGFSIPAQLKLLRSYADQSGLTVKQEVVDVETAKMTGRRGFEEMVEFLTDHGKRCKIILVEKTDRLYRNLRDYVTLDELDVEIHFVKENFVLSDDSRSTEKFMHGIKVLMAKNYVDNLSEETSKGMLEKAEEGTWPSWAPLGYLNSGENGKKTIVADPRKAPIVGKMFEWYAAGDCSLAEVRTRAIEAGLTGRRGTPPSKSTVADTLKNPFYTGCFVWKGKTYQGDHEPLISADLFERTQIAFRKDNKPPRRRDHFFAYTGLITCAYCGCAITAEQKKGKYTYYHCTGFKGGCSKPAIREEHLEELLGEIVKKVVIGPETVDWIIHALRESHRDEEAYHITQIEGLQQEYLRLQDKMDRAYEDKLEGKISEEFWERKSHKWREQQLQIRAAIERHENANQFYFDEGYRILQLASKAYDLWLQQDKNEKKRLLSFLLSNCTFDGEKLSAVYKNPFCWLTEGAGRPNWLPGPDSNQQPSG